MAGSFEVQKDWRRQVSCSQCHGFACHFNLHCVDDTSIAAVFEYAISDEHVCDSKLAQYCVLSGVDSKHESTLLLPLSSCMDTSLQALGTSCQLPMVCLTHFML